MLQRALQGGTHHVYLPAHLLASPPGQQLGKWMEEHGEARPSQRSRGSQPGSGGPTAAAGSDTEGSDRLGVLLEAARQRQLLGTPTEAEHGLEEGPRRSSSGASSSQAGLEGLAGGAGGSPPPSQGQVAAALAAAGAAARQVSSSREESSSEESSSADSGDSSSRDSSSGSEEDEQAAEASPAAPVVPAPGRRRAAAAAAAEAGSPGSTEGEGARRVVPRRAAAPRAGFGTQLHIHPPPASNKQVAAQQEQERGGKPPAKRNKRQQQQDVEAEQDEEALPAKRPRGRPPRAQQQAQQAQQGEEPPAKRPAGRPPRAQQAQQPAPQQAPQPAAQAPQLRCSSLKILKASSRPALGCLPSLPLPLTAAGTLPAADSIATLPGHNTLRPARQSSSFGHCSLTGIVPCHPGCPAGCYRAAARRGALSGGPQGRCSRQRRGRRRLCGAAGAGGWGGRRAAAEPGELQRCGGRLLAEGGCGPWMARDVALAAGPRNLQRQR